jgi:hypothetical protein
MRCLAGSTPWCSRREARPSARRWTAPPKQRLLSSAGAPAAAPARGWEGCPAGGVLGESRSHTLLESAGLERRLLLCSRCQAVRPRVTVAMLTTAPSSSPALLGDNIRAAYCTFSSAVVVGDLLAGSSSGWPAPRARMMQAGPSQHSERLMHSLQLPAIGCRCDSGSWCQLTTPSPAIRRNAPHVPSTWQLLY